MLLLLKSWTTWIALLAIVSFISGVYLIAHGKGYDKGLAVGIDRLEAHYQQYAELAAKEQERVVEYVTVREPIITERIVYVDKVRTEYEQVIVSSPDMCFIDGLRAEAWNKIGEDPNSVRPE